MDPITIPIAKWPSAARQLIVQSLRHPLTEKTITIEDDAVRVTPADDEPPQPDGEESPAKGTDTAAHTASSSQVH